MNYAKLFTLRKDGRYVGTYTEDHKQRFVYDRDPEKLYHKLEALKNKAPLTFGDHVEAWREEHSEAVGWKTAESYIAPCRRITDVFGKDYPAEVTAARVQAFLASLGKRGYARRTVQLHRDILNMVFTRCILQGVIDVSPMQAVSMPKGLMTTRRGIPEDAALEAVRTRTDVDFAPFALLCLYAGLRRGEVLALSQDDVDRENRIIHVRQAVEFVGNQPEIKVPKTATGVRDVPIPAALMPHIPTQKGYLFQMPDGRPLSKIAFRRRWLAYCDAIGHDITPHQLRHGYATILYEAGIPVMAAQGMLGHAHASTTLNIYTHLRERQARSAAARLDDYLSDNKF